MPEKQGRKPVFPRERGKVGLEDACRTLSIKPDAMQKAVAYHGDRFRLGRWSSLVTTCFQIGFIGLGGFKVIEGWAVAAEGMLGIATSEIVRGIIMIGYLSLLLGLLSLPFEIYGTFVIEERHGFNRQTWRIFVADRIKTGLVGAVLGIPMLALLLFLVQRFVASWWLLAWGALIVFSVLGTVIFPTVIAPLFNKFSPLSEGDLKGGILDLARQVGFKAAGVFVMDASKRSSHGNAYFTGLLGARRIVLFDTLVKTLDTKEALAVLAHELGHFKLHHIRNQLLRGTAVTGLMCLLLFSLTSLSGAAEAFSFSAPSSYATLILCGIWSGVLAYPLQPLSSYISRRNEFAADRFATSTVGTGEPLRQALLKMREESRGVPFAHPVYSSIYYSHPPLIERVKML